jgi:hypothetical protein
MRDAWPASQDILLGFCVIFVNRFPQPVFGRIEDCGIQSPLDALSRAAFDMIVSRAPQFSFAQKTGVDIFFKSAILGDVDGRKGWHQ